jgi:hypothetical protein
VSLPDSPSRPVRVLAAVTGSAAVIAGGLPLLTPPAWDWLGAAIGLAGAAIAAGVTKYTEGKVTPVENVEVRRLLGGPGEPLFLVAGEGSEIPTGTPVDVTPTTPANWAL